MLAAPVSCSDTLASADIGAARDAARARSELEDFTSIRRTRVQQPLPRTQDPSRRTNRTTASRSWALAHPARRYELTQQFGPVHERIVRTKMRPDPSAG